MDPDEWFRIIADADADLAVRVVAALELNRWLFNGGHAPAKATRAQLDALNEWRVQTAATFSTFGANDCPYCGPEWPCRGSARTANGYDVDAFERAHSSRTGRRPGRTSA